MAFIPYLVLFFTSLADDRNDALRQAAALDAQMKCAESEALYQKAFSLGPPSLALLNNAGNHYLLCGDSARAQKSFEQVLRLRPQHPNANLQLARIAAARHDGVKALEYLSRVNDSEPATRLLKAEALHWAGRQTEAQSVLAAVQPEASGDEHLLLLYGLTCARMEEWERAETVFNSLLSLHPEDFDVLLNLGRAAARAGHLERAQSALDVAIRLHPDSADAASELGAAAASARDYTKAMFYLAQAQKLAPERFDIALALARTAQDGGYYGDAAIAYDACRKLRPGDPAVRRDRAFMCALTDSRRAEGIRELQDYVKSHDGDPVGHYQLAQTSWRDTPEKALVSLTTALRLDPNSNGARISRAWLLNRLGRGTEAVPDLERAVAIEPQNVRVLDQLGQVYMSIDRAADSETALRRAFAIAPQDPDVLLHLGRTLMERGQDEEGRRLLDKFQAVRTQSKRSPWKEAGLIESATLSAPERARREAERLRRDSQMHPDDPELQLRLASLLLYEGKKEESSREFTTLLLRNPPADVCEEAGKFLLSSEQYSAAREFLVRAAEARPAANLDLAVALWRAGAPDKALEAIAKIPDQAQCGDCLLMKGSLLYTTGNTDAAASTVARAVRLPVSRPEIVRQAAALLIAQNRKQEALMLLEKAGSGDAEVLLSRATLLSSLKRTDEADQLLREIESKWPELERAWLAHGLLLERTHPTEAARKLRTAMALGSQDPAASCALSRLTAPAGSVPCPVQP